MSRLAKLGASLLLCATFANASDSTPDQAKELVMQGVEFCKKVGVAACVEEFNKPESQFVKGDLYIWANDFDGIITAHPKKPLKGKNMYRYKDKAGNQLFKDFIDKVKAEGNGWVDYVWDHPTKGGQTPKTSYVIGIGENQLIGAGAYK
ncbi:MAG: cache domain-containing protein [Aliarcobacter sp.]